MARRYLYAAGAAVSYFVASLPGQLLLIPNVFVAPLRLSAGAAAAALILAPPRGGWLVLLALVPRHAWAGDPSTRYLVALQYLAANAAEALVIAWLLHWFLGDRPRLDNLKSALVFLVSAVIIGPIVGATIGAPGIVRRDLTVSAFSTWEIWALADAAGNLVIIPLVLAIADLLPRFRTPNWQRPPLTRLGEIALVFTGILVTTAPSLGQAALGSRGSELSMFYAPFPLVVWASIRFGPIGAAAANVVLTMVTMLHALTAYAPFGPMWDGATVLETQQFLIVAGATSITLAALIAERWRAREAEREGHERARLALHGAGIGTWHWVFEENRFIVSDELAALLGLDAQVVAALASDVQALDQVIHPDDRDLVHADLAGFRTGNTGERSKRFRSVRTDGTTEWINVRRSPDPDGQVSGELRIIRPDGTVAWIESHGRVLRDADGVPTRAIGVVLDISGRKELESERDATSRALMTMARSSLGDRGELDEALREITAVAANTLGVESVGVWLFSDDRAYLRCVCSIQRSAARHSSGEELSVKDVPEYFRLIDEKRTLAVDDTLADSRTRELTVRHRALGVRSMLDAPLYIGGRLAGVFSFRHGAPREWSMPARNFAASMTDLLSRAFEAVERRKAEQQLLRAYEQLRSLARRLEAAKEDERRSIARELHDELGQSVTAIVIALHVLEREDSDRRHAARIRGAVSLAESLIARVRDISLNLRPPLLDELGLLGALGGYLEGQADQTGLEITFTADPPDLRVAPELEFGVFRIVQECLTNVVRHARARQVSVSLTSADEALVLEVADDGCGFELAAMMDASRRGKHLGLLGLEERVMVLGGHIDFNTAPGQGTRVSARLPLHLAGSPTAQVFP